MTDQPEMQISMPAETWEVVAPIQLELLFAVEDGGLEAGMAWLDARGLAYELKPVRKRGQRGPDKVPGGRRKKKPPA